MILWDGHCAMTDEPPPDRSWVTVEKVREMPLSEMYREVRDRLRARARRRRIVRVYGAAGHRLEPWQLDYIDRLVRDHDDDPDRPRPRRRWAR